MAEIAPFPGIRYAVERVGRLQDVVAPPYDVISPEQRAALVMRSHLNVVELDLPEGHDDHKYERAGRLWREWRAQNILLTDRLPALYLLQETFVTPDGRPALRRGFIAALTLEELGAGGVRPHERTFAGPKEDRLKLMRATNANLSQVFALYRDPHHRLDEAWVSARRAPADVEVGAQDGRRALWVVTDPDVISLARDVVSASALVIADGHHRYETAITYRNECRERGESGGMESVMAYLASMDDPDLTILPTHRIVRLQSGSDVGAMRKRVEEHFDLEPVRGDRPDRRLIELFSEGTDRPCRFGLFTREWGWLLATLRSWEAVSGWIDPSKCLAWRRLDVAVLHEVLLGRLFGAPEAGAGTISITCTADPAKGLNAVLGGDADLFCLLRSPTAAQVAEVAQAGDTMPQKSTYFYPKLLTGLVMRSLEP